MSAITPCTGLSLRRSGHIHCVPLNKKDAFTDHPQLTGKVTLQDVTFHSSSLNRDMQYRVISPATLPSGSKLPVVYLLHGGGGGFRDWSNYTDVARFAERGLILVMPEGDESYYTNSAEHPKNRYEDYIVKDLLADVQARFPASFAREGRAIVGVSMGGFGAIKLSFHHPELFGFVGGLSSRSMFQPVRFLSSVLGSGSITARSLDHGEVQLVAKTTLLRW